MDQQERRNRAIRQAKQRQQELAEEAKREQVAGELGREALHALGASAAETLGDQVRLRTPPLPRPGDSTGEEQRSVRLDEMPRNEAFIGENDLEDDYDEVMRESGFVMRESGFEHVANKAPPSRGVKTEKVKNEHPILGALRRDFGIDAIETTDVEVGGHTWTLGALDARELGFITRLADQFAITFSERDIITHGSIAAVAVRAIDGVPTYEVFNVPIEPGLVIQNDLIPPRHIRMAASMKLFEFLMEESKNGLVRSLFEAYEDKMDDKDEVTSYLNDPDKPRYRYRSPDGSEFVDFPRVDNNGKELPYFCRNTGAKMVKVSKVVGKRDLPL